MTSLLLAAALVTNSFLDFSTYTNRVWTTNMDDLIIKPGKTVTFNINNTDIGCMDRIEPNKWESNVDWESLELFTAATNLVIHTKLKPIVTKTNDTYYIELKEERTLILDPQTKGLRQPDGTYLKLK